MRHKTIKARNRFGVLESHDMVDTEGAIAIAAEILRQQPDNRKCIALFDWIAALGHMPTDAEFLEFVQGKGVTLTVLEVVEDEN